MDNGGSRPTSVPSPGSLVRSGASLVSSPFKAFITPPWWWFFTSSSEGSLEPPRSLRLSLSTPFHSIPLFQENLLWVLWEDGPDEPLLILELFSFFFTRSCSTVDIVDPSGICMSDSRLGTQEALPIPYSLHTVINLNYFVVLHYCTTALHCKLHCSRQWPVDSFHQQNEYRNN